MILEPRSSAPIEQERILDPCDKSQVEAWAAHYGVDSDVIRQACEQAGAHRVAVEIWLGEARI